MCRNVSVMKSNTKTRIGDYKTFFMLNSNEHDISLLIRTKILKNEDFSCFQTIRYCIYHANKF